MKVSKTILVLLSVCCLMAFFSMQARAADWYTCTIDKVGPSGLIEGTDGSFIYLTDTANPPAWFGSRKCYIRPDRGKEFLAVALMALANGNQVLVYMNGALATATIKVIYIQR